MLDYHLVQELHIMEKQRTTRYSIPFTELSKDDTWPVSESYFLSIRLARTLFALIFDQNFLSRLSYLASLKTK